MAEKQNVLQLTAVQLSGAVSLPVLLAGYFIGVSYSAGIGLPLIIFGNMLLLLVALVYTHIGYHYQAITVELAEIFFGERGIIFCGISLLILLLGWSVIQDHFIMLALRSLFNIKTKFVLGLLSGSIAILSYLAVRQGLTQFSNLNKLLMPGLLIILYLTFSRVTPQSNIAPINNDISLITGLVMIMTTAGGLVFDCPTYYRQASSVISIRFSLILIFAIFIPLIEMLGFYLANNGLIMAETNVMRSFIRQFDMPGLIFLGLTGFLSNCLNLYSATLVANHFVKASFSKVLLILSVTASTLALIDINQLLVSYLEIINCLAGIILAMIVTYRIFNGLTLSGLGMRQRRIHEYLLYISIGLSILLQIIVPVPPSGLFLATIMISAIVMLIYCNLRRFG